MIFTLYNKQTEQEATIYSVRNKNGYPMFLIYECGQWLWRSAKHFKPLNDMAVCHKQGWRYDGKHRKERITH